MLSTRRSPGRARSGTTRSGSGPSGTEPSGTEPSGTEPSGTGSPGSDTAVKVRAGVRGYVASVALFGLAVAGVFALAEEVSFVDSLRRELDIRLLTWAGNVSLGLLAGLVGRAYVWALPFVVAPTVILQIAFQGHLRARRDRTRMEGLFRTAIEAHGSIGLGHVEAALVASAKELLECRGSRLSDRPPVEGELGSRLPVTS